MNDPYFDLDRTNKEYDLYALKVDKLTFLSKCLQVCVN